MYFNFSAEDFIPLIPPSFHSNNKQLFFSPRLLFSSLIAPFSTLIFISLVLDCRRVSVCRVTPTANAFFFPPSFSPQLIGHIFKHHNLTTKP